MYVDAETIIKFAALLGALGAIVAAAVRAFRWFEKQEKQSEDIEKLRDKQSKDTQEVKDELCLLSYAMLACLDGLKQQGCNGKVTEAHIRLEKHINQQAHKPREE